MQITDKQKFFVKHYVASLNATEAYREAYGARLTDNVCAAAASRLLRNVKIKEAIDMEIKDAEKRVELSQGYVLDGLKQVYERCMQAEPVTDAKGVSTGEFKFNAAGANKALELLGKHLGLFTEKVEMGGEINQTTKHDIAIPDIDRRIGELIKSRESSDTETSVQD